MFWPINKSVAPSCLVKVQFNQAFQGAALEEAKTKGQRERADENPSYLGDQIA
jgi:hypothetical protein